MLREAQLKGCDADRYRAGDRILQDAFDVDMGWAVLQCCWVLSVYSIQHYRGIEQTSPHPMRGFQFRSAHSDTASRVGRVGSQKSCDGKSKQ
jgi:hypothetical protein